MQLIKTSVYHRYSKGWKTQWIKPPSPVYRLLIQFWIYWEQLKENSGRKRSDGINKEIKKLIFLHLLQSAKLNSSVHFTFEQHSIYIL